MDSDAIIKQLKDIGKTFRCNDNISDVLDDTTIQDIQKEVEEKFQEVLKALIIDVDNDHNTRETAKRFAKMLVQETFSGRYMKPPKVTAFQNEHNYDQLYMTGPITIRSTCAHHFQAIRGSCWIGVFPGKKVIGLSKFARLVDWVASRPQIQEEMTVQIADLIEKETEARGVGVMLKAEHMCMTQRGVKEHQSEMISSILRGEIRSNLSLKEEFFHLISNATRK